MIKDIKGFYYLTNHGIPCNDIYNSINDERVCEEAAKKLASSNSILNEYPTRISNSSTLTPGVKNTKITLTSGCTWQEDFDGNVRLIFNQYGEPGKCLRSKLCRTLCLIHKFFPFIGEGCGESIDMSSIKDEKTCNEAAYNLVETYPDLKELPTKANTHPSNADMFTSNNHFLFGCYWQKMKNGKNYLWFNAFGVKNECPGDSPCISICTKSECEVIFLSSSSLTNELHSEEMGTYLKLIDSVNGKVAYKKDTENGSFFLFWYDGCGWMVNNQIIQNQTYSSVSPGECDKFFNTYCINETNPINPKCSQHWKYHDNVQMVEFDLTIKVTCQGEFQPDDVINEESQGSTLSSTWISLAVVSLLNSFV